MPVTGDWRVWVREILVNDKAAPRKQRHTAERIRVRLAEEKQVTISGSSVRKMVAELKAEIGLADPVQVFVPQTRLAFSHRHLPIQMSAGKGGA